MSESQEQVTPENLKRDAWVERALKVKVRREAVGSTIGANVNLATEVKTTETEGPKREALLRRLRALTASAQDFAEIAPLGAFNEMSQKIGSITDLINGKEWEEAHKAITAIARQIKQEAPGAQALRAFRGEVQAVTMNLDKALPLLLPDDRDRLDKLLLALEQDTPPDGVPVAREALKHADGGIARLAKEGEERNTRCAYTEPETRALMSYILASLGPAPSAGPITLEEMPPAAWRALRHEHAAPAA